MVTARSSGLVVALATALVTALSAAVVLLAILATARVVGPPQIERHPVPAPTVVAPPDRVEAPGVTPATPIPSGPAVP